MLLIFILGVWKHHHDIWLCARINFAISFKWALVEAIWVLMMAMIWTFMPVFFMKGVWNFDLNT